MEHLFFGNPVPLNQQERGGKVPMKTIRNNRNKKVCQIDEVNQRIIIKQKESTTIITFKDNKAEIINK